METASGETRHGVVEIDQTAESQTIRDNPSSVQPEAVIVFVEDTESETHHHEGSKYLLPTAHEVRNGRLCFHRCLSVNTGGTPARCRRGVSQAGPAGGYPGQMQTGWGTRHSPGQVWIP